MMTPEKVFFYLKNIFKKSLEHMQQKMYNLIIKGETKMANRTFTVKRYSLYTNDPAEYYNYMWGYSIYKKDADRMTYDEAYKVACEESKFWGSEFAFTVE